MPFYEYQCLDCSEVFSLLRPMNERDENAKCPKCSSLNCKRKVSLPSATKQSCSVNTPSKFG